jgi:hypothetical protein
VERNRKAGQNPPRVVAPRGGGGGGGGGGEEEEEGEELLLWETLTVPCHVSHPDISGEERRKLTINSERTQT